MKRKLLSLLAFALLAATGAWADKTPQVLWCEGNSTLYFINSETVYAADDDYEVGENVTEKVTTVWSGDKVTNTGSRYPGWHLYHEATQNVVFDKSFADVHPESCYEWFMDFKNVETLDLRNLKVDEVTNLGDMLLGCKSLTSLDISDWDVSSATEMGGLFNGCSSLTSLDVSGWNVSSVENMGTMFYGCSSLTSLDLSGWDVSSVEDMYSMFQGCSSLECFDMSGWDVSSVTDISEMFDGCSSLTSLDVSGWNVSSVEDMYKLFQGCSSLTSLDLRGWDVSNVEDMYKLFQGCSSLTSLDLRGWNVSSVEDMSAMFQGCSSLTSLDLSGWDFSSVTEIYNMFESCTSLTSLDLSGWDLSSVTDMSSMFKGCTSLTSLDLSGWDFSIVTDMSFMFQGCTSLTTIYIDENWDVSSVPSSDDMFSGCENLVGSITYDSGKTDATYATAQGGYMTLRGPVTFSDTDDNSSTISTYDGYQAYVELTRTLKTGGWNTFAVPFSGAIPTGWTVKKLTSSDFANGELTLNFETAASIEAGKPYLVKVGDADVVNPVFSSVSIAKGTTSTVTTYADFVPVMKPTNLTGGDKSVLFVTGGNKLTYPTADGNISGFRAYFQLHDLPTAARAFRMSFGDASGIEEIHDLQIDDLRFASGTYTLDGRRIEGQPTVKGVYIVNGKKTIIK